MEFDDNPQYDLQNILREQKQSANEEFQKLVMNNYQNWVNGNADIPMSPDILDTYLKPLLEK